MFKSQRLLFFGVIMVASVNVPASADDCAALLQYAGETWSTKQSSAKAESAVSWFCSRSFESENDAKQFATEASFPIDDILVGGSLSGSGSNFKQKQAELCSSSDLRSSVEARLVSNISTINPVVAAAVATCVSRRGAGIWLTTEITPNPKVFKVHVTSQGLAFAARVLNLALVPVGQAHCTPQLSSGFKVSAAGVDLACERRSEKIPITVALNFHEVHANWDTSSTIPAVPVWKTPRASIPPCNPGGPEFIFPNGNAVAGAVVTTVVIRNATKCSIDFIEYQYDCAWPAAGPSWKTFAKAPPERTHGPDVDSHATLSLENLVDGRNNPVQAGTLCQIQAITHYSDGLVVPNGTSFRYLHP